MTNQQLKNKKVELEQWLRDNHPEHELRPHKEAELRKINEALEQSEGYRTFERDTFDIREHNFLLDRNEDI